MEGVVEWGNLQVGGGENRLPIELRSHVNGGGEEEQDEAERREREAIEGVHGQPRRKKGGVVRNVQNSPPSLYFLSQASSYSNSYSISLV